MTFLNTVSGIKNQHQDKHKKIGPIIIPHLNLPYNSKEEKADLIYYFLVKIGRKAPRYEYHPNEDSIDLYNKGTTTINDLSFRTREISSHKKEHKNLHLNFFFCCNFLSKYLNIDTSGYRDGTRCPFSVYLQLCRVLFAFCIEQLINMKFMCCFSYTRVPLQWICPFFFKKSSRPKSPFFFHKKVEKCLRSDRLREVVLFKGIKGMILCDI